MVREYENSLFSAEVGETGELPAGDYTVVLYDAYGWMVWESDHFTGADFDYATTPSISDMDHDGDPEIVVGRVILNSDGSTRGVGAFGRGSWGISNFLGFEVSESSVSAVVDLDLDGVEEVVVGNARYSPDGAVIDADPAADDGMVAIANLDDDPEGEIVIASFNTVRAVDTNFNTLWGPIALPGANIVSPPAIDDLDGDGEPEIVVAGGSALYVLNRDGSTLWSAPVRDSSGASGASIFDFEADGMPEVVYIDESKLGAFDGLTGAVRFQSDYHDSATMMEYPIIADVDADGHAEIVVVHDGSDTALSVYQDVNDSWAPARTVWNQHPYSITNIEDDLSVPVHAEPNFTIFNSWHSAFDRSNVDYLLGDLQGEIVDVCADCEGGEVHVVARLINQTPDELAAGVPMSLYARSASGEAWLVTAATAEAVAAGWTGGVVEFVIPADQLAGADAVQLEVDHDRAGVGGVEECAEDNNGYYWAGPFCP